MGGGLEGVIHLFIYCINMRLLHEIELKEIEVILEVYEKNDSELYKTNDQPSSYIYITHLSGVCI